MQIEQFKDLCTELHKINPEQEKYFRPPTHLPHVVAKIAVVLNRHWGNAFFHVHMFQNLKQILEKSTSL